MAVYAATSLYSLGASDGTSIAFIPQASMALTMALGVVLNLPQDTRESAKQSTAQSKSFDGQQRSCKPQGSGAHIQTSTSPTAEPCSQRASGGLRACKAPCPTPAPTAVERTLAGKASRPAAAPTRIPKPPASASNPKPAHCVRQDSDAHIPSGTCAAAEPCSMPALENCPAGQGSRPAASPTRIPKPPTPTPLAATSPLTKTADLAAHSPSPARSPAPTAPSTPTAASAQQARRLQQAQQAKQQQQQHAGRPTPLPTASKAASSKGNCQASPLRARNPTPPHAPKSPTACAPRKPSSSRPRQQERAQKHASTAAATAAKPAGCPAPSKAPHYRRRCLLPSADLELRIADSAQAQWLSGGLLLWSNPLGAQRCMLSADLELRFSHAQETNWLSAPLDETFLLAA